MTPPAHDVLAIIPARRGSKRLPGKNLRMLANKPMIQWTIEAAIKAALVSRILITTDSDEILELGRQLGVDHLVTRPTELSGDTAKTSDALSHAISQLTNLPDGICLLQPTSPLRISEDIDAAIRLHLAAPKRPVVSVCPVDHPTAWSGRLGENGSMAEIAKKLNCEKRSQDYLAEFRLNGAIYVAETRDFLASGSFLNMSAQAYIMPRERSIDIDTPIDLVIAEAILKLEQSGQVR